jgi:hypothetical protein
VKYVEGFISFWYDFIVGDDWRVAAGVVVGFGVTGGLAHSGVAAWWIVPLVVVSLLSVSLWTVARGRG